MKLSKLFICILLICSIIGVSAQYIQGSGFEYYACNGNEYIYIPEIGPHTKIWFTYNEYDGDVPFEDYITHYNKIKGKLLTPYGYYIIKENLMFIVDTKNKRFELVNPNDETKRDMSIMIPYGYVVDFRENYQIPTYQAQQTLHTETYTQIFTDYPQIIPILLVAIQMAVWLGGRSYIRSVVVLVLGAGVVSILLPGVLVITFTKTPEIIAIIIAIQFIGLYQEFIKR